MTQRARIRITDLGNLTIQQVYSDLVSMGHLNYTRPALGQPTHSGIVMDDLVGELPVRKGLITIVAADRYSSFADYTLTGEQWRQFVRLRLGQPMPPESYEQVYGVPVLRWDDEIAF